MADEDLNENGTRQLPVQQRMLESDVGDAYANPLLRTELWKGAQILAATRVIPAHFQDKVADVFVMLDVARRMGMPPLLVLQNTYMVKGRPAWMTEFLVALCRIRGIDLEWRTDFEMDGAATVKVGSVTYPRLVVHCFDTTKPQRTVSVSTDHAIRSGWVKNEKYEHDCEGMLQWRAASRWISRYAPHIKHGLAIGEDLEDEPVQTVTVEQPPATTRGVAALREKLAAEPTPPSPSPGVTSSDAASGSTGEGAASAPTPETTVDDARRKEVIHAIVEFEKTMSLEGKKAIRAEFGFERITKGTPIGQLEGLLAKYQAPIVKWTQPLGTGSTPQPLVREDNPVETEDREAPGTVAELIVGIQNYEKLLGEELANQVLADNKLPPDPLTMTPGQLKLTWNLLRDEVDQMPPEAE